MAGQVSCGAPSKAHPQALDAEIRREFQVRVAIADHEAARLVDRRCACEEFLHHAELGLAAGAVLALEMRADEHRLELDALRGEQLQDEAMRVLEALARKGSACPGRPDW